MPSAPTWRSDSTDCSVARKGMAYATLLRPDVTLRAGDRLHVFDAKFRLDRFNVGRRGCR